MLYPTPKHYLSLSIEPLVCLIRPSGGGGWLLHRYNHIDILESKIDTNFLSPIQTKVKWPFCSVTDFTVTLLLRTKAWMIGHNIVCMKEHDHTRWQDRDTKAKKGDLTWSRSLVDNLEVSTCLTTQACACVHGRHRKLKTERVWPTKVVFAAIRPFQEGLMPNTV